MKDRLHHHLCEQLAAVAKRKSDELGIAVTISIADDHGCLKYLHRFDDAIIPSVEISQKKAYTAATLRQPTKQFGQIAQAGAEAFGINITHPQLVIFGGGYPLEIYGETVGGIGISGGSVTEDEAIAQSVLAAFRRETAGREGKDG